MRCLRRRLRCLRADPAQPTLFDDGVESPAADGERFYDDDYREAWRAIVLADISRTASVRLDRLTHRVARAHGFLRTGQEIQDRVSDAIPRDCKRTEQSTGPSFGRSAWTRLHATVSADRPPGNRSSLATCQSRNSLSSPARAKP